MYESFYGLDTKPFSLLPDPEFLYLGKKHRIALTLLEYALVNNAGFCVISGEIGAGKTTLLRKLLNSIEDNITVGMITNTHQSFGELLDWVLSAFGIHQSDLSKVEKHQHLVDFLLEQYANNKTTLLIVDEAQNMPAATLEELRMLSNINSEKDLVLQVILSGQPDLKDTLRKPELTQFAQRISVDFHLDTLNSIETCSYIQHRLVTAGATNDIFTPDACRLIHQYSGGVPRLINLLCDTALVYGFADQRQQVDVDLVEEMVSERMQNSILPLVNIDRSHKSDKSDKSDKNDDADFPWISPNGGTEGLKPEAEKKTAEKAVSEIKSANNDSEFDKPAQQSAPGQTKKETLKQAGAAETVTPAAAQGFSTDTHTSEQQSTERQADPPAVTAVSETNEPAATFRDGSSSATGDEVNTIINAVAEPGHEEAEKHRANYWLITLSLVFLALLLSFSIISYNNEAKLKGEVKDQLVEAEEMKRNLEQLQQQAEIMQRQRDAALEKARQEEKQHAEDAQAAAEASNREKAAMAAAALAAEQALKAAREVEALTKKQRLEEKRLSEERKQLQLEKRKAELDQQHLERQRRQAQLEKERLEIERIKAEKLAQQEREQRLAKEQAELFKSIEEIELKKAEAKKKTEQKTKKEESSFSTDPCSTPSAKFLSTCR